MSSKVRVSHWLKYMLESSPSVKLGVRCLVLQPTINALQGLDMQATGQLHRKVTMQKRLPSSPKISRPMMRFCIGTTLYKKMGW